MKRRSFLVACGALSTAPMLSTRAFGKTVEPKFTIIQNAYMLWYNRPSIAEIRSGFAIAYTTRGGDLCVMGLSSNLQKESVFKLHSFEGVSDYSSPSIIRIPDGPFAGHIMAFFSNHASELYFTKSKYPDSIDSWDPIQSLDSGRATYPAPFVLPGGVIGIQYTLQHQDPDAPSAQWRTTVHRVSHDGGITWTDPSTLLDFGHDEFPYSTPLAISSTGQCALAYSIYSETQKRDRRLSVLISNDGFVTTKKFSASYDIGTHSFVPYEIKWKDPETLMLSYSVNKGPSFDTDSIIASINVTNGQVHRQNIGPVATHTYPGGAALLPSSESVIYSPLNGGLTLLSLHNKRKVELIKDGGFASPFIFQSTSGPILIALRNPIIKTTRDFQSDLLIMRLAP